MQWGRVALQVINGREKYRPLREQVRQDFSATGSKATGWAVSGVLTDSFGGVEAS
jgi:hypothetical protein